jgi:hypothetical protein
MTMLSVKPEGGKNFEVIIRQETNGPNCPNLSRTREMERTTDKQTGAGGGGWATVNKVCSRNHKMSSEMTLLVFFRFLLPQHFGLKFLLRALEEKKFTLRGKKVKSIWSYVGCQVQFTT